MKYSDVKLGENCNQETEEWSVEKHTEQTSTDAYGVINFQGGSHSYRAKACMMFCCFFFSYSHHVDADCFIQILKLNAENISTSIVTNQCPLLF